MQDFEASDGVAATNIDTTINATRMGSLVLVAPAQGPPGTQPPKAEDCKLFPILKDNIDFKINHVHRPTLPRAARPASVATASQGWRAHRGNSGGIASLRLHLPMAR